MGTDKKDFDAAAHARTAQSDIFGKLDDEMAALRINSDALMDAKRKAAEVGMTLSERVRLLIYVDTYGLDHVLSVQEGRTRRAVGNASHQDFIRLNVVEMRDRA